MTDTVNTEDLFQAIQKWTLHKGFETTWEDVETEFAEKLISLSKYKRRRLRTAFDHWITRQRLSDKAL